MAHKFGICQTTRYIEDLKGQMNKLVVEELLYNNHDIKPPYTNVNQQNVKKCKIPFNFKYPTMISMVYQKEKVAGAQFREEMQNIWLHIGDEEGYRRYLSVFKKTFSNYIYKSLDNLEPSSLAKEAWEAESNGVAQEKQEKEPQNFKGGQYHQNEKFEVQEWKTPKKRTKLHTHVTGVQMEPIEGIDQVVKQVDLKGQIGVEQNHRMMS